MEETCREGSARQNALCFGEGPRSRQGEGAKELLTVLVTGKASEE